jgi:biopolymer transport protein ExbD
MAEMNNPNNGSSRSKSAFRRKILSTRVDLTPMVDLGFLLITFFIFTTTMSQANAMKLIMPNENGEPMSIKETGALTLMPSDHGKVYYYEGQLDLSKMHVTNLKDMRQLIMDKKQRTKDKDFFVVIKPADSSSYGDLVKVLDEMKINEVKRYAISNISKEEIASIY